MKPRIAITVAAFSMLIAVAAGAFGAHGLKAVLSTEMLAIWQTAVHYQMVHGLGLLAVGILMPQWPRAKRLAWVATAFVVGIILFSGSLYLLALSGIRWLGAVTPLGGVAFLAGWLLLAISAWQHSSKE
ncbi:DUF423 domain-containing protein [Undibacterium sp. CY7W]|uniref:DUF423 domain-containing protein n=1 Tax=Undibacterium rugosum TaxID=2762291 RepID=A0A923HXU7_9BURK|nr:DUF423 domain-containing protein [Undibacterium rugosum]MBC3934154.1 DUF423 domain-containing protein [Undibacterium rugosum]